MKKRQIIFLILLCSFFSLHTQASTPLENCSYAVFSDVKAKFGKRIDDNPLQRDVSQVYMAPGKGCGTSICSALARCEGASGNIRFIQKYCKRNTDGSCPHANDCKWVGTPAGDGAPIGLQANYPGKGEPIQLRATDPATPSYVGNLCSKTNSDFGTTTCKEFCKARCEKLYFHSTDERNDCLRQLRCQAAIAPPAGGDAGPGR